MQQPQQLEPFRTFDAFSALSDDDLLVLADRSRLESVPKSKVLFNLGEEDPWIICLVKGSLELTAPDGKVHRIDAGTRAASQPVGRLKPRQFTARTVTPVQILRIDESELGDWQSYLFQHAAELVDGISVQEDLDEDIFAELDSACGLTVRDADPAGKAAEACLAPDAEASADPVDLPSLEYELPSLPNIAMEACRVADADKTDIDVLARLVVNDPPIAAKLIKAANSPVFYGRDPVGTCQRAIVRLGLKTTRQLIVAFAIRDLFKCNDATLERRMQALWDHSVEVAAISYTLARRLGGFDPGEAQLAGLLHDIGVVSVLSTAASRTDPPLEADWVVALAERDGTEIGQQVLAEWNFPEAIVIAARDAEQWWRDDGHEAELADLVLIAQLVSFIGKAEFLDVPPLIRLPAFKKLFGNEADVHDVLQLLEEASEQISDIRGLLQD